MFDYRLIVALFSILIIDYLLKNEAWNLRKIKWWLRDQTNLKFRKHIRCGNCNVVYHPFELTVVTQSDGSPLILDYNCETLFLGLTH